MRWKLVAFLGVARHNGFRSQELDKLLGDRIVCYNPEGQHSVEP